MNLPWRRPSLPTTPVVLEVERATRVPELTEDMAKSIGTLQSHPGFQYLLAKLKFHRSVLKEQLAGNRQETMADVIMLQSGVAWSGWLQGQLDAAMGFKPSAPAPAGQSELAIFEEAQRQLEVLR